MRLFSELHSGITGPQLDVIIGDGDYYASKPDIQTLNEAAYFIDRALEFGGIYHNCPRQAAFIALVIIESDNLKSLTVDDRWGRMYEGDSRRENIHPGDGVKYKPRGAIKIIGRSEYRGSVNYSESISRTSNRPGPTKSLRLHGMRRM